MKETFLLHVGERLKEARTALGLTQDAVAELVGITREHWGRCERGQSMPGGEVLAALAGAGSDVNYILTGKKAALTAGGLYASAPVQKLSTREASLIDNYRHATEAGRKALEQTGSALAQSTVVKKSA